jgi:hypothetical protein
MRKILLLAIIFLNFSVLPGFAAERAQVKLSVPFTPGAFLLSG